MPVHERNSVLINHVMFGSNNIVVMTNAVTMCRQNVTLALAHSVADIFQRLMPPPPPHPSQDNTSNKYYYWHAMCPFFNIILLFCFKTLKKKNHKISSEGTLTCDRSTLD